MTLAGKTIAILIAPRGTEEPELAWPGAAVEHGGGKLVTSRNPDDLPAFCAGIVEVFA